MEFYGRSFINLDNFRFMDRHRSHLRFHGGGIKGLKIPGSFKILPGTSPHSINYRFRVDNRPETQRIESAEICNNLSVSNADIG